MKHVKHQHLYFNKSPQMVRKCQRNKQFTEEMAKKKHEKIFNLTSNKKVLFSLVSWTKNVKSIMNCDSLNKAFTQNYNEYVNWYKLSYMLIWL